MCSNKNNVLDYANEKSHWYDITVQKVVTLNTSSHGDSQVRSFVNCAAIGAKKAVQENNVSLARSPVIDEEPSTEPVAAESASVGDEV